MTHLIINIKTLFGVHNPEAALRGAQLSFLPAIANAFLLIEDGIIAALGNMYELPVIVPTLPQWVTDAEGQTILPCWCDSHTHLVFAKTREEEFLDKLNGLSYAEIASRGGGILNSAAKVAEATTDQLFNSAWARLQQLAQLGTGAIEVKSGYGLTLESELKMLRVIKRLKEKSSLKIKATFLGAHSFPLEFRDNREKYIQLIVNEMLPQIHAESLADYVDVFCDKGFYTPDEMEFICRSAMKFGLKPKVHVNQLASIGGLQKAVSLNAVSADHLESMTAEDINDISSASTIATLLPTAAFFLRMAYQPARELITAGSALALASDYNPGSSPSGNMNFVIALSCIQMKMLPEEAINAATINGAFAMECNQDLGSISAGKKANLIFTRPMPSLAYFPYSFGENLIDKVMLNGNFVA